MKKMNKWMSGMLASSLALTVTVCAGSVNVAAEDEKVTLVVSTFFTEETRLSNNESDSFWTMIEKFQSENPDITVEVRELPQTDYETKTQAQATAGELPDLFFFKGSWTGNFVANDALYDISDALDAYEYKDAFHDGMFDPVSRDGRIYALPAQLTSTHLVYYNEALWKEAGYDAFPTTWEELYEADAKFDEMGIPTICLGNLDAWPAVSCILSGLGDRYTGTDWTWSIINNDGQAKFTDQAFVDALAGLQNMVSLFNEDYNTMNNEQSQALYSSGEAAATIDGAWVASYILNNATDEVIENTRITLLPAVDGGAGDVNTTAGGCGWFFGLNSNVAGTEKEQAALDLLFNVYGYEYSDYIVNHYGFTAPCIVENAETDSFPQLTQDYLAFMNSVSYAPIYDIHMEASVIEALCKGAQNLLNGEITPEELAAAVQAEQDLVAK